MNPNMNPDPFAMPSLESTRERYETHSLEEINDFYTKYYGGKHEYAFIEGDISRPYPDDFRINQWQALKTYAAKTGMNEYEARPYVENCHCCGESLDHDVIGQLYCSAECSFAIEHDGYCCYFNDCTNDCLVCTRAMRVRTTAVAPIIERIKTFYYLCNFNPTHDYSQFGVNTFRSAEALALKHHITLHEAALSIIDQHPISKTDVHEHPLVPYRFEERAICEQCQHCFANFICEHEECQHVVCFDCHYTNVYNKCGENFRNTTYDVYSHLSQADLADLTQYAADYGVSMNRAFDEQTRCHQCKVNVVPQTFGPGHQFCSAQCDVIYELKPYWEQCTRCHGNNPNCQWCDGKIYKLILTKERGIRENEPILAAIQSLKHLMVYNQLDDCLFDLVEYSR
jgi:hypothetical protein